MDSTTPPLEYLVNYSQTGLQDFELARLDQLAALRKEFGQVFEELVEAETSARLARALLEFRRTQSGGRPVDPKSHVISVPENPKLAGFCAEPPISKTTPRFHAGCPASGAETCDQSTPKNLKGKGDFQQQNRASLAVHAGSRLRVLNVSGNATADLRRLERHQKYMPQPSG
jgi:hypothetical protein